MDFTEDQILRYSRHIILPEVGGKGQAKIAAAKVFLVGAGGLGSPVGYFLTAAGVGRIAIIDDDHVELSNLQRQIAHSTKTLGMSKVQSAKETFNALNPEVEIVALKQRLTRDNILELIKDYDIVVDGSDNFPTRYLVNDACVMAGKPLVSGAVLRFEGQVTTILPKQGHCYRCLFEEMPPPGLVPSCQEAGVLGVLPGIVGGLQAMEVLKLIIGKGDVLRETLLIIDALKTTFRKVRVPKNPQCPVCSENPTITELQDYNAAYCTA
ncbi:MAG: molybdopterin-synthase adenylyltransferase MoeB [Nitrospirae bacterium]|uniref:molybdopterin-synthase adenylyltransferase MoeB n=1 Tax=Candidatus Magnetobacterium casense TaxID=1455061 RepID=UPI00059067D5|nr:molybdopterin-synthase adenylyltransferase MoeB [Candidatus Magnetobacterium casensis]MBF0338542.1 molybdopterin-synthase adenylyltransferase MoeB [Nitrospirota bacterium]